MNETVLYGALAFACLCLFIVAIGAALTGSYVAMLYDLLQRPPRAKDFLRRTEA